MTQKRGATLGKKIFLIMILMGISLSIFFILANPRTITGSSVSFLENVPSTFSCFGVFILMLGAFLFILIKFRKK